MTQSLQILVHTTGSKPQHPALGHVIQLRLKVANLDYNNVCRTGLKIEVCKVLFFVVWLAQLCEDCVNTADAQNNLCFGITISVFY